MNRTIFVASLALLVFGCVAPVDDLGEVSEPIVNGTLGGERGVVAVQNIRAGGLCTGSLIGERVVLTAKHCIQEAFAAGPVSPSEMIVGVGDNVRGLTSVLRVQEIITTPGQYTEDSRGSVGRDLIGVDVAVLILQSGVASIEPFPIRRASHTALTGQTITAIGFGQTPSGQVGVKYTTTGRVQGTDAQLIYVGPITCQGDSGGPAITPEGEVAGVVSFGAGSCGSGYGAYNAIFPFLGMIDDALTRAGACLNDGAERCDGADNDCDDLVDEDCTPLGGACSIDSECVGVTCRDTSDGRICTSPCDPLRPEFGCEPGFYCAFSTGCEGYCVPQAGEGTLTDGADCTSNDECRSLFCHNPGDGRQRCLTPCRGDAGMCLAGEACAANPGDCAGCVDASILNAERGLGEECAAPEECRSGVCLEDAGRSYCTRACTQDSECASGYHCRDLQCASGPRGEIGDPCVSNDDCGADTFCASRGGQSWCTRVCGTDECPTGFDCVAAGTTMVCAPILGLVGDACVNNEACVTNLCATLGAAGGTCTRMCGADAPCAPGFECRRTADGVTAVCIAPAPTPTDGGCSVAVTSGGGARGAWVLGLLALAVIGWRRRRLG